MTAVYVDSNVLLYAIGTDHRYREPCRRILRLLAEGTLRGEISTAVLQELVHHRRRRGASDATARAREAESYCAAVHDVTVADLHRALTLIEDHPSVRTLDAIHAAVALERGLGALLSADAHFDAIPGIRRVDPLDEAAVAQLTFTR